MSALQSPLFEPVLWRGAGFEILDEIQLPEKIEYLEVRDVSEALRAVREMKTRAFGQVLTFLYSGALLAQGHPNTNAVELHRRLAEMTEQFCNARPTFDFRGLGSFFEDWFTKLPPDKDPREMIAERAQELGQRIVRGRLGRAKLAAAILPNPARVLTHCNVSGELVAIAQYCKDSGKEISVLATETRPYLQGTRLTAWELARAGVGVAVIPDCAVAQIMAQGELNAVIVGADRAARNGDIINKVGTYPLALMAKEYGVPFYALVQDPRSLASGEAVAIEERPAAELLTFHGQTLIRSDRGRLNARYPAFDITPAALITHLVGFDGIYTPESFRQKYQGQQTGPVRRPEALGRYLLVYGVPQKHQYGSLARAVDAEGIESVLVPEMRPQLWGPQTVAPALLERNLPTTLIADNMMGILFARGEIRRLCLFHDGMTNAGARAICGSLLAVRLARLHHVPVELLSGAVERAATRDRDISTFLGRIISPPGVAIREVGGEMLPVSLLREQE